MKLSADWLNTDATKAVMGMLGDAGYDANFVGGCVRNALLGRPVSDLDVATNARPETVMSLAKDAGLRAIPTGMDHGTITVVVDGCPYEITTYRTDVETDGRHAVVAFSDSLEHDAERRDFTMNALYAAADGTVTDPVNGLPDLHAGHVRFINDPAQRITEDYLRILRFFRFTAWYGNPDLGIDADGLAACAEHLDGLDGLAKERITDELVKLLSAPDPAPTMASMAMCGALMRILPGTDVSALAPLVHIQGELARLPFVPTRLAALGACDAKGDLRLPNKVTRDYETIRGGATSGISAGEAGFRFGADMAIEAVMLRAAMIGDMVRPSDLEAAQKGAASPLPVTAADLMPAYEGPALGERLRQLEAAWIASGFALSKSDLLALP